MDTSTLKPAEVAAYFLKQGVAKHRDRYESVFLKAVLAGVMLSFGGLLSEVISGGAPGLTTSNPGIVKILGGFVFPVGLVMIVLQGLELLTSNMMVFPMAVLKGVVPWWSLPLNWLIVSTPSDSGILSAEPYATYVKTFAIHKASDPQWHQIFLRGIGCNWLVCIAVWQAAGAKDTISKIYAIWLPIWLFVAFVANMFSVPLGIMFGADLTVAGYIRKSLIASLIGNIVGALFVALPATYFYLWDYDAGGLRGAEAGEIVQRDHSSDNTEDKIR
ncbi:Formate/nitrite transporter [Mycena latifolia]|nr:Formate/nitrite transporter [Mycena latifolia]